MPKFDMGAAWDDVMVLVRSHFPLTSVVAGVFLFLPSMVTTLLGPAPFVPQPGVSPVEASAMTFAYLWLLIPWFLFSALASTIGSIAILRLWLARSGTSVGDALLFALIMLPTAIALFVIQTVVFTVAMFALIVPALYLMGRLSLVYPYLTDRGVKNPIAALVGSWTLTRGNGWRIFLFIALILVAFFVIVMLVSGVTSLFGGYGSPGFIVGSAITSLLGAGLGLLNTAVIAATYRQLALRGGSEIFS
jgi:hypothetical protein